MSTPQRHQVSYTHYNTREAAARLVALFSVEERTAQAMLTIAAELGEYELNNVLVIGDEDEQCFHILVSNAPRPATGFGEYAQPNPHNP